MGNDGIYLPPHLGLWVFPRICRSEDRYALALGGVDWARRRSSGQVPYAWKRPGRIYRDDTDWRCGVTCRNLARSSDRMVSRRAVGWLHHVSARSYPTPRHLSLSPKTFRLTVSALRNSTPSTTVPLRLGRTCRRSAGTQSAAVDVNPSYH